MKKSFAFAAAVVLLVCSKESLAAAQRAVLGFWEGFLPAMLPFFLLTPYCTAPDAQRVFERIFGRALQKIFGIPGKFAGAIWTGAIAGTPAGAVACAGTFSGGARELCPEEDALLHKNSAEYFRACALCSGLSPAFLISSVGGMLGGAEWGTLLWASNVISVLFVGVLLRRFDPGEGFWPPKGAAGERDIFTNALVNLGKVLCWMVIFAIVGALAAKSLGKFVPEHLLAPILEIAGGARMLAGAPVSMEVKLVGLAFATGFGGLCVLCQCSSATGVPIAWLFPVKIAHGSLSAVCMRFFLRTEAVPAFAIMRDPLGTGVYAALGLVAFAAFFRSFFRSFFVDGISRSKYTYTKEP